MKITIHLSKAELDLIEEALLQYQNLLIKSANNDPLVQQEIGLCRRVLEEFGVEELEMDEDSMSPSPKQYPFNSNPR
ncbi:hypothetical protein [Shimazuella alba]|jgi:hypothetical protein|uniref:Uncharacterized protein n=1 Tax=Shimazuella alba TaxID=2690964 RepID=A0A6I4VWU7_9BACL|nr:hypothetical protein [Shimazuella alba]MXQ54326.1 hypothetical protein [Shimazuella alba]